jgi:amidohydrolase
MTSYFNDMEIAILRAWRHKLHQFPEISGEEIDTGREVVAFLCDTKPEQVITNLGGHGVALVYEGARSGPTVLLRCELDALPIHEVSGLPYRSRHDGKAHMCGHDGHMTMMAGVARYLGRQRPECGRAVLLFQPAEETAGGAEAVLADPKFAGISPDYSFAIHNMPGLPLAHIAVAAGQIACASMGLRIELKRRTADVSVPETGISPAMAVAHIITAIKSFNVGHVIAPGFSRVTLTSVQVGEPVYGVTPGSAELCVTLRCPQNDRMPGLLEDVLEMVREVTAEQQLTFVHSTHNFFRACVNDPEAAAVFEATSDRMSLARVEDYVPIRGSEDFGLFGSCSKSALLFLGTGLDRPMVHNPDYDFPDELIPVGGGLFVGVLEQLLGFAQPRGQWLERNQQPAGAMSMISNLVAKIAAIVSRAEGNVQ